MTEPLLCARHKGFYVYHEGLLSSSEVSWAAWEQDPGLCFFFSPRPYPSQGWARARHLISPWLILESHKWEVWGKHKSPAWVLGRKIKSVKACFCITVVWRSQNRGAAWGVGHHYTSGPRCSHVDLSRGWGGRGYFGNPRSLYIKPELRAQISVPPFSTTAPRSCICALALLSALHSCRPSLRALRRAWASVPVAVFPSEAGAETV